MKYVLEELLPVSVVKTIGNVIGTDSLFRNKEQIVFEEGERTVFDGKGSIILDFGKEYYGMLRIMVCRVLPENSVAKIKIRLGESLAECCAEGGEKNSLNFHGIKNMDFDVMMFSDIQTGYNGFRYARIDVLSDCIFEIINCKLVSRREKINRLGYFESDNERVNQIFDTAARTVELCQQNGLIWDGIKRDRIVWIGDLHPEALAVLALTGDGDRVIKCLELMTKQQDFGWINNIPSYSIWYIIVLAEVYYKTANRQYILDNRSVILKILKQIDLSIDDSGNVDFKKIAYDSDMSFFLDWQSFETFDAEIGTKCLIKYGIKVAFDLLSIINEDNSICIKIEKKVLGWDKPTTYKQVKAFQCFAKGNIEDSDVDMLAFNGAQGVSTFMAYYILKTMAEGGKGKEAYETMKVFYGAMLDLGATTFFEDFDIEWLKDDPLPITSFEQKDRKHIHADFGKFCYKGFRHSLCHGWAAGVIPYIFEKIVGIEMIEPGYKKIKIKPELYDLKYIRAGLPTPYGLIEIVVKNNDGKIEIEKDIPSEIVLVE